MISSPLSAFAKRHPMLFRTCIALAFIGLCVAAFLTWRLSRIEPLTGIGPVELGMKQVEVSLAYGRQPDCGATTFAQGALWVYDINILMPCDTTIIFRKTENTNRVSRVCSKGFLPYGIANNAEAERDILRKLGQPSYVSLSSDGTSKISSFEQYNVAFELRNKQVQDTCVTRNFPVRYPVEYADS